MSSEERSGSSDGGPCNVPPIDFKTFVLSLSSAAMMHLGAIPDPDTHEARPNLPLARHTIEILAMLEQKTAGNLDESESKTLGDLLYRLRMSYLEAARCRPAD
jgi:hypothetical protein